MSDYRSSGAPDPTPGERRFRRMWWGVGIGLLLLVFASVAVLINLAMRPPGPDERAKTGGGREAVGGRPDPPPTPNAYRPTPAPAVPPRAKLKPREVPMGAQAVSAKRPRKGPPTILEGFRVEDEHGSFEEPPVAIITSIDGQAHVTLKHLWLPDKEITVPVEELKIVQPFAKRTKRGSCCGSFALQTGRRTPRNSTFYRNPRVACAAYTAYILRHCGRSGGSFSATAQYGQLRRWGGRLVATRMSTRYIPYLKYLQSGDYIYFHKGSRFGHTEIYVGNGMVSGTSSSQGRVAIRRLSNRGFSQCSVVRL